MSEQEPKREYFKERYNFLCCKCGAKLWAEPSIMMTGFGMNQGRGSCLDCGEALHLEIRGGLDGETMISTPWDDFLKDFLKTKELVNKNV